MPERAPQLPVDDEALGIASALIKARNECGFSQAHLSEVSGVSRSAIKGYESGRNMPGSRELKALCAALKVSPTTLLFGSEDAFQAQKEGDLPGTPRSIVTLKLVGVSSMLVPDEIDALVRLATSIAVARHGIEATTDRLREATKYAAGWDFEAFPGKEPDAK